MITEETTALTPVEVAKLSNFESVIERGRKQVFEVARALREIRDGKLYRAGFATFDEYCETKWSFKRSRAAQLIGFYKVLEQVCGVTAVNSAETLPDGAPDNERFTRELQKLRGDQQQEAWQQILTLSDDGKPTLSIVKAVVDRWLAGNGDKMPEAGGATIFDAPQSKEPVERVEPLRPAIERDSAAEVDRIAESTGQALRRDWRALPVEGREKWYAMTTGVLEEFARELFSGGDVIDADWTDPEATN